MPPMDGIFDQLRIKCPGDSLEKQKACFIQSKPFKDKVASPTGFEPVLSRLVGGMSWRKSRKKKGLLYSKQAFER